MTMVRAYFPQKFKASVPTNTNFPPQGVNQNSSPPVPGNDRMIFTNGGMMQFTNGGVMEFVE